MKQLVLLFAAMVMGTSLQATPEDKVVTRNAFRYGNSFIFVENGVTFSVYPDGEFDFYIDNYAGVNAHIGAGPVGITFNSGFNYNPYVQYDDYGAVIQVENIPIYYDYYGRVNRIGGIDIWYRNGRAFRIGGMRVFYNNRGFYDYHVGYINVYNRRYIYRPFHRYFARPAVGFCMVYNRPYRRFYQPVRYTYYAPYRYNHRRAFAHVGKTYRYKDRADRSRVYRNDRRVAAREPYRRDVNRMGTRHQDVRSNARSAEVRRSQPNRAEANRRPVTRSNRQATQAPQRRAVQNNRRPQVESRGHKAQGVTRTTTVTRRSTEVNRSPQRAQQGRSQARTTVTRRSTEVSRSPQRAQQGRTVVTRRSTEVSRSPQRAQQSRGQKSRTAKAAPGRSRQVQARSNARSGRSGQ
ncbi:hypothetical protein OZ410_11945 [Robiginitalea sp. M366]|uniref:hypothetical protein n=1 Tax=Robiginitalea aestuariiviva TaxID=3036903 RepID=UPI00240D416B|nr:hypothetical protein [Robiginitalea aestuariiviva]MDG1573032.1 hypothetical protein [Robiginitalea aestuariiviva]